jgi:uncharacterized protein YozE (UPF0346 family)
MIFQGQLTDSLSLYNILVTQHNKAALEQNIFQQLSFVKSRTTYEFVTPYLTLCRPWPWDLNVPCSHKQSKALLLTPKKQDFL